MAIPNDIENKLESNPSWTIQHRDIVEVMEDHDKDKPWSRYMIGQHLDGDPAKKTVQDRLDELVELDVLVKYEYRNVALYDLAYAPVVTDGGHLSRTHPKDVVLLRDIPALGNLAMSAIYLSGILLAIGIFEVSFLGTPGERVYMPETGSVISFAALVVFGIGFCIAMLVGALNRFHLHLKPHLDGLLG
jgi:hypothetical protein